MNAPYLLLRVQTESDLRGEIQKKIDEFLDVYSLYQRTRLSLVKDDLKLKAYELRMLDSSFSFQI
ncbi:MAG: hypothetical protein HYZ85_04525 [Candidatus Omnitrophica bacterium]|nr:hypothetical protein [Candidatus Omnitrophota bacterium]